MSTPPERAAGFYWVDFGWDSGPIVARWVTAAEKEARFAGTGWTLPEGATPSGHWELPSDECVQPDHPIVRVLGETLQPPGNVT